MRTPLGIFAATAVLMTAATARAADSPYGELAPFRLVEEVRVGAFADDAVHRERQAPMASFEVLSSPLTIVPSANPWLAAALNPRFEAGALVNMAGLTSYAFAGLNWRTPQWGPLFLEAGLGGAVNDSSRNPHDMRQTDLGCPVSFRESGGIGWRFSDHFDVVASVEHISHANLCSRLNPGLTSFGLRVGYRF